jgi:hypothetical protein
VYDTTDRFLSQPPTGLVLVGQRILARHSGKRIVWVVTLQHRQAALVVTANLKGHTFQSYVREAWQLPPCNIGETLQTCNTNQKHYLIDHQSLASTKLRHQDNNRSTDSKVQSSSSAKHAIRPPLHSTSRQTNFLKDQLRPSKHRHYNRSAIAPRKCAPATQSTTRAVAANERITTRPFAA